MRKANRRLKGLVADQALDIQELKEALGRKTEPALLLREPLSPVSTGPKRAGQVKYNSWGLFTFEAWPAPFCNEQGWPSEVLERQLPHGDRNKIRASYNSAQHLPEHRRMMQAWADYLDALRKVGKVMPIFQAGQLRRI